MKAYILAGFADLILLYMCRIKWTPSIGYDLVIYLYETFKQGGYMYMLKPVRYRKRLHRMACLDLKLLTDFKNIKKTVLFKIKKA